MLKTLASTGRNRTASSARSAAAATAGLWAAAVLLFTGQEQGDLAIGDSTTQIIVYWLLAAGCTVFWCTFMRVGRRLVDADWHIAYELDPESVLAPGRDRQVDRVLARGLAADRPPDFWPATAWRVFTRIGVSFWAVSILVTAALLVRWLPLRYPERGMLLVILMTPAVHCTAAGVIGPSLTRMLRLREAAREARSRLCEHTRTLPPRAAAAEEDLRDTAALHVGALGNVRSRSTRPHLVPLHLVDDAAGSGRHPHG